uniref:Novel STAND NTPase 3 domain-containing protein n=1 Tax=Magallana gigas TaxID=29159 RepID=A0A8W8JPR8_MAGGI
MGTLLFSILLLYESRKLEGYKFPVYSTEFCPRNQTEWDERSSAINCTETNGYMCLPNEQRTELIEFCYIDPFAWVEEGVCLYLIKGSSRINGYNCVQFISGCPTSSHRSSESYICLAADKRRSQENEYSERSPFIDRNTDSMEKGIGIDSAQGRASCKRSSDDDTHASGELKPFHEKNEQNKLDPIREESQLDQAVFEDWKDIDSKFIETNACKKVESLIQKENLVIVVGNSGSGKSATIQHIALKYRNEGWVVKKANELKDAIDAFKSNNVLENQTLFVLDDPIGKESFDEQAYKSWKIYEDDLKSCFKKFKCKMLFSCRKCVQSDKNAMGLFKNESNIVDIDADDCKLRYDEKRKIWNKYKSNNTSFEIYLTEIIKNDAYFPLLCKLFFSDEENQKDVLHFFKEPVEEFKKEIEYYKRSSKDKFCALVLLVLFNNELCVSDLQNEGNSEQMYKLALKLCGMEDCTAPSTIRGALETLHGSYVTKKGDSYQFCHDFVMEVTSYVFGTEYPKVMIQYADIGFLRKRVKLDGCNGQNDQMTIYISDLKVLTERLLKEIVGKDIFDVVLNPCLKLKYVSSDWCDKDDITGQYLLRKDNIVDNMYDLDSFFSLFVFCQVEELTREYNDTL